VSHRALPSRLSASFFAMRRQLQVTVTLSYKAKKGPQGYPMTSEPVTYPRRQVAEWTLRSDRPYRNPYADVAVEAAFTAPSGATLSIPGFHDGDGAWCVRFNPAEAGRWRYRIVARPADPELAASGEFDVTPEQGHNPMGGQEHEQTGGQAHGRGFLRATPGQAWGFHDESGAPVFILGDTMYNLFGMAHCGADVEPLLRRRAAQGFNLIRTRVPVSPINVPPDGLSTWQTCSTWPWGGVPQLPLFDRFNLAYFRTVDRVVRLCERIGIGLELIMEGWPYEFPFNRRDLFLPEWEELWLRYLIARYDAFHCVHIWTIQNEYEFYPDNDRSRAKTVADRWALRVGRLVKAVAAHGHVVAVHNTRQDPPFAERFAADPGAIDAIMYQEDWGARGEEASRLCLGAEDGIARSLEGWTGSAVFAEYGYERNPDLPLLVPAHRYCDPDHTRRGAWRAAFCALGVVHGFDNTWGVFQILDQDQPGLFQLLHLRRFLTEVAPFERLQPAHDVVRSADHAPGHRPLALALASPDRAVVAAYLPVGGHVNLTLPEDRAYEAQWFDPRGGELSPAQREDASAAAAAARFAAPADAANAQHDWTLVLKGAS